MQYTSTETVITAWKGVQNTSAAANVSSNASEDPWWVASLSLEVLAIVVHSWIFASYIWYQRATRTDESHGTEGAKRLKHCTLAVVILPYLRFATTQSMIWVSLDPNNKSGCNVARILGMITFTSAVVAVYLFLWSKQRVFYSHPLLQALSVRANRLSWAALAMIVTSTISAFLFLILPELMSDHTFVVAGPRGCVMKDQSQEWFYPPIVYGSLLFFFQVFLFTLFLYPLCHHYRNSVRPDDKFLHLIRRATISAVICLFSDSVVAVCIALVLPSDRPESFEDALYDVTLTVDVIAVFLSYSNCKRILLPCSTVTRH